MFYYAGKESVNNSPIPLWSRPCTCPCIGGHGQWKGTR